MNWKDRIEKNAFVVVVGACVATGATVASVMEYYATEKIDAIKTQHNSEMIALKTQLASITRSMGHEEYLDVRKMVVPRDRVSPEPNSQYFDDADFYAPAPSGDWLYSKSSEEELLAALMGQDLSKTPLHKLGNVAPIHLWRNKKTLHVEGHAVFKNLFGYVYVTKVPVNKIKEIAGALDEEDKKSISITEPAKKTTTTKDESVLDSLFRGDIAGKLLTFVLVAQLSADQLMSSELVNVQKVHNVVYMAARMTLKGVKVDKVSYSRYYLNSETIIISIGDDAVMVKTLVPSTDPAGSNEYSQYVTRWFNGLRVLAG
jgi:hypothetical protein